MCCFSYSLSTHFDQSFLEALLLCVSAIYNLSNSDFVDKESVISHTFFYWQTFPRIFFLKGIALYFETFCLK
jgi:hypothetical protein